MLCLIHILQNMFAEVLNVLSACDLHAPSLAKILQVAKVETEVQIVSVFNCKDCRGCMRKSNINSEISVKWSVYY